MLLSFFCRRLALNHTSIACFESNTRLGTFLPSINGLLLITTRFRCFSSEAERLSPKQSFSISYLINSCGFSAEAAKICVLKYKILFDNSSRPESVRNFLRHLGFTDTQISILVKRRPKILLSNCSQTVLPKLEFLRSIGFSSNDLRTYISRNQDLLRACSLNRNLIPSYEILKNFLLSDKKVVMAMKELPIAYLSWLKKNWNANISVLKGFGMSQSTISSLITTRPQVVCLNVDKLTGLLQQVVEMGFDPVEPKFVQALRVKSTLTSRSWKRNVDALMRWDLSEDEILLAFRKHPYCMLLSEELIMSKMDFLVNKMGWSPALVVENACILCYSLEKRIVPRCSVIRVLFLKGLIKDKINLRSLVVPSDMRFLGRYVIKHKIQAPELLDVFEGKVELGELGFEFQAKGVALPV